MTAFFNSVLFFFFTFNYCHCQNYFADCSKDSVEYQNLNDFLNEQEYMSMTIQVLFYKVLDRGKNRDCLCDLIVYAKVFDFLLQKGLDLNYSIAKNPPIINSTNLPKDSELVKLFEHNNLKHKLFSDFLKLKKNYERFVVSFYDIDKNKSLEQDVSNIVRYGGYTHPKTLTDILLSKYKHLTRDKMEKELLDHRINNRKN